MDRTHHHFDSRWHLPAPPAVVHAVLERVDEYPRWWPQVRSVTRLDDATGVLTVRSLLPYTLTLTARETRRDPAAGVLEAAISGDLKGWARWTITADGTGSLARYEQDVDVTEPFLRRLPAAARPLLRANHRLMMRAGHRGLLRHLRTV
ncbi:SRPBCC family protein [Streptomyces sp. NPDC091281]|uniref:SRPBCC family protein n=1 Tax=Streptomyces sp. NPDC091281 TaxID=3365985 RepID=UPI0037F47137